MSAYQKSIDLNLGGTDAEKVAILQTLTVSDIPTKSLARLLREESLLLWTGEKYVGSIQTLVTSQGANLQFVAGIDDLKSAVFGGSAESLLTTVPKWSVKVWAIVSAIVALVPDTAGLIDRVYALDGGRPYKDLTVPQFVAQRTAAVSEEAATVAIATKRGKLQDAHISVLSWIVSNPNCTRDAVLSQFAADLSTEGWA